MGYQPELGIEFTWLHEMGDQPELGCACVVWCSDFWNWHAAFSCVALCFPVFVNFYGTCTHALIVLNQLLYSFWETLPGWRMLWLFWINCCIVSEKLCLGAPVFRVATRDSVQFWIVNFWCTMAKLKYSKLVNIISTSELFASPLAQKCVDNSKKPSAA